MAAPARAERRLSLPSAVAASGGVEKWNAATPERRSLLAMLDSMVTARTVEQALAQLRPMLELGNHLWAYMYMRMLQSKDLDLYYEVMLAQATLLLPVMYTPTVGEACQKFGQMPFYRRGCYLSISDRGRFRQVLQEYADAELPRGADGKPVCDCIVFSDGGRILGLGDLGAWGMGIPLGKLDLYTVCGGVNPHHVIPVIMDSGCSDASGNTAKIPVRDHPSYVGLAQERVLCRSSAGTLVNCAYYGEQSTIRELMEAATGLFGKSCLLQFEDFNSNDAFPLLAEYRDKYLTYNDDIQGTAAITVAGILGAIKLKNPSCTDLIGALRQESFLFHGAGSANLGAISLLAKEGSVCKSNLFITNSRGLIWRSEDGSKGSFRNDEQKEFAHAGEPQFNTRDLVSVIGHVKPTCIVGAVGVAPNCFTREVVEEMLKVNREVCGHEETVSQERPIIFALSNPKSQAEITAQNAYAWSDGAAIFGSGTHFDPVSVAGREHAPGQVNNVYIFPGMSFGAICCKAKTLPDRLFMIAAEAVANSLDKASLEADRVIPPRDNIREVSLNVATAVVVEAQRLGLAERRLGEDAGTVKAALRKMMWLPARAGDAGGA